MMICDKKDVASLKCGRELDSFEQIRQQVNPVLELTRLRSLCQTKQTGDTVEPRYTGALL